MEQLKRIQYMEQILDTCTEAVEALSTALDAYEAVQGGFQELSDYYEGPLWRQDLTDDDAGKLPQDLKRGVLSEDAVYDLLMGQKELLEQMEELTKRARCD